MKFLNEILNDPFLIPGGLLVLFALSASIVFWRRGVNLPDEVETSSRESVLVDPIEKLVSATQSLEYAVNSDSLERLHSSQRNLANAMAAQAENVSELSAQYDNYISKLNSNQNRILAEMHQVVGKFESDTSDSIQRYTDLQDRIQNITREQDRLREENASLSAELRDRNKRLSEISNLLSDGD